MGTGVTGTARQGYSAAISADGNTAVVGAPANNSNQGAIWIYTRSGGVWTQQGSKLVGTGAVGKAQQGACVAISADGNTIIEGGYTDNSNQGAIWVFTRSGGVWAQQGSKLTGSGMSGNPKIGYSVALSADGNTAATGHPSNGSGAGGTYIFSRNSGVWSASNNGLVGSGAIGMACQGFSIALSADGNTLLTGGPYDNSSIGAAWIFTCTAGVWTQQGGKLVSTDYQNVGGVEQGEAVALSADGNTAVVASPTDNGGGGCWVYTREGTTWAQVGTKLNGTGNTGGARQGSSIALSADGSTFILGGVTDNSSIGAAWVFITDPVPLPLYWLSVNAKAGAKNEITVSWSTSTEINTSYFEVQRSTGNEPFMRIGTVSANGNPNTVHSYILTDKNTPGNGVYHYRTKQVDVDGKYTYSPVATVRFNSAQQSAAWQVYPNPVRKNGQINLTAIGGTIQADDAIQVVLTTVSGQIIYQVKETVPGAGKRLNERLASLTSGVYTIVIRHGGEQKALQLIVQ